MRTALAAHDEVLRSAIEAHGGFLFKHTGDGVCAAFASPRSAVDAAIAAQRELELPVRMGIATGEAELRGRGLLRCGAQPRRTSDGRRAWWSDPCGRFDGGVCSAESICSIWGRDGCGMCRRRSGCFRSERRDYAAEFPPLRALDTSPGKPAACGHQFHRARVRGRRGASGAPERTGW